MNKLIIFNEPVLESITLIQMIGLERVSSRGVDTADFGIDPISSKYRASIADTHIKHIHLNFVI